MKVKVTYKTSHQVGPDDWDVYTEVLDLETGWTLEDVYEFIAQKMRPNATRDRDVHVELHYSFEGDKK